MGSALNYNAGVVPLGGQTQVIGVVNGELKVFKVDGLVLGELDAEQADVTSGDGGFT